MNFSRLNLSDRTARIDGPNGFYLTIAQCIDLVVFVKAGTRMGQYDLDAFADFGFAITVAQINLPVLFRGATQNAVMFA